jgi:putative holliday junction resolvase
MKRMVEGTQRAGVRGAAGVGETSPMRVLAIDYGRRRIGLALSDELGLTARPLATLTRTNRRNDLNRLRAICRSHGVARVIVGHPLHLAGGRSEMADETARFADRLRKELGIPAELVDERLTSWEAKQTMESKSATRPKTGQLDGVAAALLLSEFLDRERRRIDAGGVEND